jgi:GGDEF domain-containing protein
MFFEGNSAFSPVPVADRKQAELNSSTSAATIRLIRIFIKNLQDFQTSYTVISTNEKYNLRKSNLRIQNPFSTISRPAGISGNLRSISLPVFTEEGKPETGASIGIALYPDNGDDAESLTKEADKAMYKVKKSGKNGFRFSDAAETSG